MLRKIPNLITILRLIAVPVIVLLLIDNRLVAALWVIMVAGLSDGLDGYLAKRFKAVTPLGAYLDPIADKTLLIAVFLCLTYLGLLPGWIVCVVVMRDVLIVGGAILSNLLDLALKIEPISISKLNTFLQIALGLLTLFHAVIENEIPYVTHVLVYCVALTTFVSGTVYLAKWSCGFEMEPEDKALKAQGK